MEWFRIWPDVDALQFGKQKTRPGPKTGSATGARPHLAELAPQCAQSQRLQGRYELIMGSDVLYKRDDGGILATFISRYAAETGEVLIVDPNRANRAPFHRRMAAMWYGLSETMLLVAGADATPPWRGRLLHCTRGNSATARKPY